MASFLIAAISIPAINISAGMILEARADDDFGTKEILPRFGQVHCPQIQVDVAQQRVSPWVRVVGLNNVVHNSVTDTYTFDLEADNISATLGAITQAEAQDEVDRIGGMITGVTARGVSVSVPVQTLIVKWITVNRPAAPEENFTHVSHAGDTHTYDFEYENVAGDSAIAKQIAKLGGTLVSQNVATKIVRFEISRQSAIAQARSYLQKEFRVQILPASWSLTASGLSILLANGGEMTVTPAQLLNNIEDLRI